MDHNKYLEIVSSILKNYPPDEHVHTSGPKIGEPIAVHLINVGFTAARLASLYSEENTQLDQLTFDSFVIAAFFHDTNKLDPDKKSLRATVGDIDKIIRNIGYEGDYDPDLVSQFAACHGKNGPIGSMLLMPKHHIDLCELLRLSDILDLYTTSSLDSIPSKLNDINMYISRTLPERKIKWITLKEFRGILTTEILNTCQNFIEKNEGVPIAFFKDGLVFLEKQNSPIYFQDLKDAIVNHLSQLVINPETAILYRQGMIQIKPAAFKGISLESILDEIIKISNQRGDQFFYQGLHALIKKIKEMKPKTSKELLENTAYCQLVGIEEIPKVEGKNKVDYEKIALSSPKTTQEIKEEFLEKYTELHHEVSEDSLRIFLENYISNTVKTSDNCQNSTISSIVEYFVSYGKPKATCSMCGAEYPVDQMQAAEVNGISVQKFSNSLPANAKIDPKRYICEACRIQLIINKQISRKSDFLIVGVPFTFIPARLKEMLADEMNKLRDAFSSSENDPLESSKKDLIFQLISISGKISNKKQLSSRLDVDISNTITYRYDSIHKAKNDSEKAIDVLVSVTNMYKIFPMRYLITNSPTILGNDIFFSEPISFQSIPSNVYPALNNIDILPDLEKIVRENVTPKIATKVLLNLATKMTPSEILFEAVINRGKAKNEGKFFHGIYKLLEGRGYLMDETISIEKKLAEIGLSELERPHWKQSDYSISKPFEFAFNAVRKFDPSIDSIEGLKGLIFNNISRAITFSPKAKEFTDAFMQLLEKYGNGDFAKAKEKVVGNYNKLRGMYIGLVKLLIEENKGGKEQ